MSPSEISKIESGGIAPIVDKTGELKVEINKVTISNKKMKCLNMYFVSILSNLSQLHLQSLISGKRYSTRRNFGTGHN
jgi:hypothetical protein